MSTQTIKWVRIATVLATAALAVGACAKPSASASDGAASDSAPMSPGAQAAREYLQQYTNNPTSIGLDMPLAARPATNKSMIYLLTPPAVSQRSDAAFKNAAKVLGWTYSSVDAGATPATAVSAFEAAIAKKPDAIMFAGYPAAVFAKQIQEAKAAGITVISNATGDKPVDGVLADLGGERDEKLYGKLVAAYFVANAGDRGKAAVFSLSALPILTIFSESFVESVKEWCPTCEVEVVDQQLTDLGSKTPANVVSHLQRNPDTKWAVFANGDLAQGVAPAIKTAGIQGVKIVGEVPTEADLANLKSGSETAWVGYPVDVLSWRMVDILARSFEGSDVAESAAVPLPLQIITKENADSIVTDDGYYTAVDGFEDQFAKLWGVS